MLARRSDSHGAGAAEGPGRARRRCGGGTRTSPAWRRDAHGAGAAEGRALSAPDLCPPRCCRRVLVSEPPFFRGQLQKCAHAYAQLHTRT